MVAIQPRIKLSKRSRIKKMSVRMLCHRVFVLRNVGFLVRREFSAAASENLKESPTRLPLTMSAWQIKAYNGISSLELVDNLDLPPITKPNDVLVEVRAASINTLDVMMTGKLSFYLFIQAIGFSVKRITLICFRGLWSSPV